MADFLTLVRDVVRESGTSSNFNTPSSVVGATGRMLRFVHWTRAAYEDIQRHRDQWRWMQGEFEGHTINDVRAYDAASLGIDPDRFSHWLYYEADDPEQFSVFTTATGRADEGFMRFLPWTEFRRRCLIGDNTADRGKPLYYTVDPQDHIQVHPMPDGDYTLRGTYYKAPQVLMNDTDIPEMPARFHRAIQWKALMLMGTFDEAFEQEPRWAREYGAVMSALARTQLPRVELAGPLA
jgi:hypothetical protein